MTGRDMYHKAVRCAQPDNEGSGRRTDYRWWDLKTWDPTTRSVGVAWVCITIFAFYVPYARHEGLPVPDGPEWLTKVALQLASLMLGMRLSWRSLNKNWSLRTRRLNRPDDTRADVTPAYEIVPR